jgi:hypothetical protein
MSQPTTIRTYRFTLTGSTPLLMHHDDVQWADLMEQWKLQPGNKKRSRAGDDRSPAWRWIGCVYHDGQQIAMPSENLMRCLMEGGSMVLVPGGKMGKTFKAQTQSGCFIVEPFMPLLVNGKPIPIDWMERLQKDDGTFEEQEAAVAEHGFMLFVKRAKIGQSKHIRVRPRFDHWQLSGTLNVLDEQLTTEILQQIFECAGRYKGLGDWRPGGKTPGPHGMFTASLTKL